MKRPTFFEGVLVAAAASLAGGASYAALALLFPPGTALRLVLAALSLAYIVYLVRRADERVGRITAVALWAAATGALWLLDPPLSAHLCAQLGLVWLVRSLYFHSSLLAALADLGLVALGVAGATWSASRSHSVALSLWCFFLVQALYVVIPARVATGAARAVDADAFDRAHRAAESALRRMHSVR